MQKVQHVKLARERALSAEDSDSDIDDHTKVVVVVVVGGVA